MKDSTVKPSFARTRDERDLKIREAQAMVGRRLERVRYFDIDYDRPEHIDEGPRTVTEPDAWLRPIWDHGRWHTVDYGAELTVHDDAQPFSITWDRPGHFEGLRVHHEPFVPEVLLPTARTAVWDVTDSDS